LKSQASTSEFGYGSHLYLKGRIFYFRYVLSKKLRAVFGKNEIRLSLNTPYLKEAVLLSQRLFSVLLDYKEGIRIPSRSEPAKQLFSELNSLIENPELRRVENSEDDTQLRFQSLIEKLQSSTQESSPTTPHGAVGELFALFLPLLSSALQSQGETALLSMNSKRIMKGSELIEKYAASKMSEKKWRERTVSDHKNRLYRLVEILGDKPINQYSRDDMRYMRDTLRRLPPNRKYAKAYQGKTISELLCMKHEKTLAIKTVNDTMEDISGMFTWATRELYLQVNPARGLSIRDDALDIERRRPFDNNDIKRIFAKEIYQSKSFINPAYYWCPLIALFTGMRIEEISQLYLCDLYEWNESGVYVFDINNKPNSKGELDKELKTKHARRLIPVHSTLLKLGLLEYRKEVELRGEERLFPELRKTKGSMKYGIEVGKHFSRFLDNNHIPREKKTFHSFRHSFSQFYKERQLHDEMFRQLFGHEETNLAARQYGTAFTPVQCVQRIEMLNYPIDVENIAWKGTEETQKKPEKIQRPVLRRKSAVRRIHLANVSEMES